MLDNLVCVIIHDDIVKVFRQSLDADVWVAKILRTTENSQKELITELLDRQDVATALDVFYENGGQPFKATWCRLE